MNIEPLDRQTVKIILSADDMEKFNISYDEMDYNNPSARKIIMQLLHKVREKTSIDLNQNKIFIEAFPINDGGCVLYLNIFGESKKDAEKPEGFNMPLIFLIENLDSLRCICDKLYHNYHHLILKSSLYETDENYILTVYSYCKMNAKLIAVIKEYGYFLGKGELKNQMIKEHSSAIVKDKAVEMIHRYIS